MNLNLDNFFLFLSYNRISSDEKERLRRLKEMKTKQVEMEAMREAELKLKRKVCAVVLKLHIDIFFFFFNVLHYVAWYKTLKFSILQFILGSEYSEEAFNITIMFFCNYFHLKHFFGYQKCSHSFMPYSEDVGFLCIVVLYLKKKNYFQQLI